MNETERRKEWLAFIRQSQTSYKLNALKAVYESDGQRMLEQCLRELGWERSVDLIKAAEAPEYRK